MSGKQEFSKGGVIPGPPTEITVERLGIGIDGVCIYRYGTSTPDLDPDVFWTKPEPERDYSGERG